MTNEEYCKLFMAYRLNNLVEDISDDGEGVLRLTHEGEKFVSELQPESPRPTGEEGLKKEFSDMLLHYIDKDIEEIDLWKWIQEQLSLAREEGFEAGRKHI